MQPLYFQTSQSLSVYSILCEKYKLAIERDPQYLEYLDKIGQVPSLIFEQHLPTSFPAFLWSASPSESKTRRHVLWTF